MELKSILGEVRKLLDEYAGNDIDKRWYSNRYVFARLSLDERKTKTGIKRRLFEAEAHCHGCRQPFTVKKDVHLHRMNEARAYSDENCVLMHKDCHESYHKNHVKKDRVPQDTGDAILVKSSKRYETSFVYWWDIAPNLLAILDRYESIVFLCKDTGCSCAVPVSVLMEYLTPDRQTTRGEGNWGIKVRRGREDELAFEPGKSKGQWLHLPVVWVDESQED